MRTRFVVSELDIDPMGGVVAEQGWQSWSPSATYPVGTAPFRWADERMRLLCYRPEVVEAGPVYRGEGLLADPCMCGPPPTG